MAMAKEEARRAAHMPETLEARAYWHPEVYEREKERIFSGAGSTSAM